MDIIGGDISGHREIYFVIPQKSLLILIPDLHQFDLKPGNGRRDGKKVGQLLYEKAMAIAGELAVNYVWLGVWEKNARAIRFYSKNGFEPFDKHIFKLGDDVQTDIMMKKPLDHYTGKA